MGEGIDEWVGVVCLVANQSLWVGVLDQRFRASKIMSLARCDRKKVYRSIDEVQADLDLWIREYNEQRPHLGRWCFGKTPMQTFLDAMSIAKEKMIAA